MTETGPDDTTLADMLGTGATYRQLDVWVRQGHLSPDNATPGSGYNRTWTHRDLCIAYLMVRLIRAGLMTNVAADWARNAIDHDVYDVETEDGISILWRIE